MAQRSFKPYIITLLLMVATSFALAFTVDVNLTDQAGVKMKLPQHVGDWTGDEVRFCQNPVCNDKHVFQMFLSAMTNRDICTHCGQTNVMGLSKIEVDLLPHDTEGVKELYKTADGRQLMVSIVLSGKERASIHRPETCMQGQGSDIKDVRIIEVPLGGGRPPLHVKILELVHEYNNTDGTKAISTTYYSYWFSGKGRETPEHWQRMVWMATDRIFHSVSHRWAYISVAGVRTAGNDGYQDEIKKFVSQLYPEITLN